MRRLFLIAALAAAAGCASRAPAAAPLPRPALFRALAVGADTLALGARWTGAPTRGAGATRDTTVVLRGPVALPGAPVAGERVRVRLTPGGRVRALDVDFPAGTAADSIAAAYTRALGAPAGGVRLPEFLPGPRAAALVWEDARTHFQLHAIADEPPRVTASLWDRGE
jgi:hypothetical protein